MPHLCFSLLLQQWIRAVIWVFHEIRIFYLTQGSQPLWKSGKTLKMSFQFSSQGKLREFGENAKNQGKLREFVTVTQKGKVFASLGYVRLAPCVQVVFID